MVLAIAPGKVITMNRNSKATIDRWRRQQQQHHLAVSALVQHMQASDSNSKTLVSDGNNQPLGQQQHHPAVSALASGHANGDSGRKFYYQHNNNNQPLVTATASSCSIHVGECMQAVTVTAKFYYYYSNNQLAATTTATDQRRQVGMQAVTMAEIF